MSLREVVEHKYPKAYTALGESNSNINVASCPKEQISTSYFFNNFRSFLKNCSSRFLFISIPLFVGTAFVGLIYRLVFRETILADEEQFELV
jgi:hypothetical protein